MDYILAHFSCGVSDSVCLEIAFFGVDVFVVDLLVVPAALDVVPNGIGGFGAGMIVFAATERETKTNGTVIGIMTETGNVFAAAGKVTVPELKRIIPHFRDGQKSPKRLDVA